MMVHYVADDFADIAKYLKKLEELPRPLRWGLWYLKDEAWIRVASDGSLQSCKDRARQPTIYATKEEADALLSSRPHLTTVVVKEYEN